MLSIESYLEEVFKVVRMQAQLEELRRIATYIPSSRFVIEREEKLTEDIHRSIKKLDKSAKPLEIAPWEQYIDVLWMRVEEG